MSVKKLKVNADNEGRRIDNYLLSIYKSVPKSKIYKIIRKGEVRVNSSRIKAHYKLCINDLIRIPPNLDTSETINKIIEKKDIKNHISDILYEDANYLILNKNKGISVHGGTKHFVGLIDIVRKKFGENIDLCHRLDKDTTGCIVFAKNKKSVKHFNETLKNQNITKTYNAILVGNLKKNIKIDTPIYKEDPLKIKNSLSKFKIIKNMKNCTFVEVQIYSGRTHQIRLHASSINHPVLFDDKYGDHIFNKSLTNITTKNIALHSKSIIFKDISLNKIEIYADLPQSFKIMIDELE
jgi:23S rRNA pseudouridine955/2504/2580 synthase